MSASENEPVFSAPWEARVFALQQSLMDKGVFSASEWAERLGAEIAKDDCTDDGEGTAYYRYWLRALEGLIAEKSVAPQSQLSSLAEDWLNAAARTPHGQPIALKN